MVLFGMMIGVLIILGIVWSANNPNLMYFEAANVITLVILAFTLYADKKSSDKLDDKIDKIIGKLTDIEVKVDGLYKR